MNLGGSTSDLVPRAKDGNLDVKDFHKGLVANLQKAQTALYVAQEHQRALYNKGRLNREFEEGEIVLINPHTMSLTKDLEGKGRKLVARYKGPFEIIQKLSPTTYQIKIPSSNGIHPVISIAHLKPYQELPAEFGERSNQRSMRSRSKNSLKLRWNVY